MDREPQWVRSLSQTSSCATLRSRCTHVSSVTCMHVGSRLRRACRSPAQHPHRRLRHLLAISARNLLSLAEEAGRDAPGVPHLDQLACRFVLWSRTAADPAAAPTLVYSSEQARICRAANDDRSTVWHG